MQEIRLLAIGAGVLLLASAAILGGCTQQQVNTALSTPTGALFCAVQQNGGGAMVVSLLDAKVSAVAPTAASATVLAAGLTKVTVDADCAAAGKALGGVGVAVSPPSNPDSAPKVAIVVPTAAATSGQ